MKVGNKVTIKVGTMKGKTGVVVNTNTTNTALPIAVVFDGDDLKTAITEWDYKESELEVSE